ncbi:unnamed protein product [Owenia fusiformis]|uniref:Uncharacterized protein n=1 Tax=Owenia fusiformis TaxID=6347 RepID=A0A8J1XN13_OWEFU|nr:unnamed protein product [Owenia fusiformis]
MATRGSFGSYEPDGHSSYQSGPSRESSNDYTRLSQTIGNNIQKISSNVSQLQQMINKIGTQQDSQDLRDKSHNMQHYTNQIAKETTKLLKDLAHIPTPISQSETKQRKMMKERLMNDFTAALNNFQAAQRQCAEKEKESVKRARAHSGLNPFQELEEKKSPDQLISPERGFSQTAQVLQMEEDIDLDLIKEREESIKKLEGDIMDVNTIFKDLGQLVYEQGETIDSIESNVESAAIHVEEGNSQLSQAKTYQSKARRKKCICIIVVFVILAILGLIIGLSVGTKK